MSSTEILARVVVRVRARGPEAWRWSLQVRGGPFGGFNTSGWRDLPTWELAVAEALIELDRRRRRGPDVLQAAIGSGLATFLLTVGSGAAT